MENIYAFNKTVIGQSHIDRNVPCEDYSACYSSEDRKYHIIAIADGHGSKEFFRSSIGSKIAVEIAISNMKELADSVVVSKESEERFYEDMFSNPRYRNTTIQFLTNAIIAQWHDSVNEDFEANPPTKEEIADNTNIASEIQIPHIYGTTLIAALLLPNCLIVIHQGDGRCEVFFEDGSVDQPVPWDKRCEDTATTSLCDADAVTSIRSYVHDQRDKKIVACFLGSDGVEDTYRDTYVDDDDNESLMGGVHTFYKDLLCHITDADCDSFESYLDEMLPSFSAGGLFSSRGSQDDVSIAGIIYKDDIEGLCDQYRKDIQIYSLREQLFWKNNELLGKTRKHGILEKRLKEKADSLDKIRAEIKTLEKERDTLEERKLQIEGTIKKIESELDQIIKPLVESDLQDDTSSTKEKSLVERFAKKLGVSSQQIEDRMSKERIRLKRKIESYNAELADTNRSIEIIDEEVLSKGNESLLAEAEESDARKAFEEYDAVYIQIQEDCHAIEKKISDVLQDAEE